MKIRYITEDSFWGNGLEKEKTKFKSFLYIKPNYPDYQCQCESFYEVEGKGKFVYLSLFKKILVPDIYEDSIDPGEIDLGRDVDFSDWKLEKISDERNKNFIINQYKKHSSYFSYAVSWSDICGENGEYKISNSRLGKEIVFSIYVEDNSYSKYYFMCFPEKAEEYVNIKKVNKIETTINLILNGIRETNKGSNIQG